MNSSDNRRRCNAWRTLVTVFVIAVAFNYVWELAQSSLYEDMGNFNRMLWHCFAPSLGDGLLTLLILVLGWAALRRRDWFAQPGVRGYALMLIAGLVISIAVELVAVYVLGRWAYSARMPVAPGLGVGLAPVAQMLVLPPIIFRVAAWWVAQSQ
jgi:hypothetical protein